MLHYNKCLEIECFTLTFWKKNKERKLGDELQLTGVDVRIPGETCSQSGTNPRLNGSAQTNKMNSAIQRK